MSHPSWPSSSAYIEKFLRWRRNSLLNTSFRHHTHPVVSPSQEEKWVPLVKRHMCVACVCRIYSPIIHAAETNQMTASSSLIIVYWKLPLVHPYRPRFSQSQIGIISQCDYGPFASIIWLPLSGAHRANSPNALEILTDFIYYAYKFYTELLGDTICKISVVNGSRHQET